MDCCTEQHMTQNALQCVHDVFRMNWCSIIHQTTDTKQSPLRQQAMLLVLLCQAEATGQAVLLLTALIIFWCPFGIKLGNEQVGGR